MIANPFIVSLVAIPANSFAPCACLRQYVVWRKDLVSVASYLRETGMDFLATPALAPTGKPK